MIPRPPIANSDDGCGDHCCCDDQGNGHDNIGSVECSHHRLGGGFRLGGGQQVVPPSAHLWSFSKKLLVYTIMSFFLLPKAVWEKRVEAKRIVDQIKALNDTLWKDYCPLVAAGADTKDALLLPSRLKSAVEIGYTSGGMFFWSKLFEEGFPKEMVIIRGGGDDAVENSLEQFQRHIAMCKQTFPEKKTTTTQ